MGGDEKVKAPDGVSYVTKEAIPQICGERAKILLPKVNGTNVW